MTPEEKANEIVSKYEKYLYGYFTQNDEYIKCVECALIAVKEVVDQWFGIDTYLANGQGELNPNYKYWLQVKKEVENL